MKLADALRHIDYNSVSISDYSRNYILQLLPNIDYYLDICNRCLNLLSPNTHTVVDYGGGHGFLCFLAKERGFPNVIYIDYNPEASRTVDALAKLLGYGPDTVLTGDENTLKEWCDNQKTIPDALMGIDVIEHIYRLESFFQTLYALNPSMEMVFSTGSTPYNPWVKRRLRRIMRNDELGDSSHPGFLNLRRDYIVQKRPDLTKGDCERWAKATRGLTYADIDKSLLSPYTRELSPYPTPNTCDPATGSWTERILPLHAYQAIVAPRHITLNKGFYNTHRGGAKGSLSRLFNALLHLPATRWMAPFIILKIDTP